MFSYVIVVVTLCAVFANGYGSNQPKAAGVGAYAYQDSDGNRYGGTYDLNDEDVADIYSPAFQFGNGLGAHPFFPDYFTNLQNLLKDAFRNSQANQRAAYNAATQAFDQASNNFGVPNFGPNPADFGAGFIPAMPNIGNFQHPAGGNSAYAAGSINPQGSRQIASISPNNPNHPNVDVSSRFGEDKAAGGGDGGFYSVSSSSYSSSSDQNGRTVGSRGAKTVVNDNGKVKEYSVHS